MVEAEVLWGAGGAKIGGLKVIKSNDVLPEYGKEKKLNYTLQRRLLHIGNNVRERGLEPRPRAWEARILPLNYSRI